jgi:flagella basal body P-ring formation protein FlgA
MLVDTFVSIRRPATLHLHSENSSATLQVRALQSGALGEIIRVRIVANGHILVARVTGPDLLDAAF